MISKKLHKRQLPLIWALFQGAFVAAFLGLLVVFAPKSYSVDLETTPTATPTNIDLVMTVQSLVSSGDCALPCWWGLTLGIEDKLTLTEMLRNSFGAFAYQQRDGNTYDGVRVGGEYSIFYLHLDTRNEIRDGDLASEGISFWVLEPEGRFVASRLSTDLPALSYVDWTPYMPSSLLSKYGAPDLVTFVYPTDMLSGYTMIMRYFDLGLFVGYDFPYKTWVASNKSILICNQMANDFMYLLRLGITVVADYSVIPENNPWPRGDEMIWYERRLEDITTLDLETFTEIFSHENVCFTTLPIDEWPELPPPSE